MLRKLILTTLLSVATIGIHAQRIYLSGTGADNTKTWDFYCSGGQHSGRWSKIQVPSCWELQGFGAYTYGRFYKKEGLKPSDETGRYRTKFTIPKSLADKHLRLTFEGAMTDTKVWIDGRRIGDVHQGGFTEFSYDITDFVTPGKKHTLEVLVSKESANKSVNSAERRADWWLFGGIYRPVYIEVMPKEHIENLAIDARADGDVFITYDIIGKETAKSTAKEPLELTLDGRIVPFDKLKGCYHCGSVTLWDPEHPNLHEAVFKLKSSGHQIKQRIGFRTIEFRAHDGLYLNGTKLIVKGTNRHCFHPEYGRTTSRALSIEDAKIIKGMNMNAVRCHYPSDRHFLEVCDSVGLLYLDELPGWQTHYDDTMAAKILPEFLMRDVNHPCVFIWSNGNEGGWNTTIDHKFAELDPQHRKVIHPWADYDGIDTHHYPAYQTGAYRMHNGQNVFMPTEFLHSKYDKGGGTALRDMWSHWMQSPLFAGGFIWAYMDEAVRRTDLGGLLDSDGGNGPDGVINAYRQPEGSYWAIREVWSPIQVTLPKTVKKGGNRMLVENQWLYTNLKECSMEYQLKSADGTITRQGTVNLPAIAPGERAYANFELPDIASDDIIEFVAYNINKEEVCRWSMPLHRAEEQISEQQVAGMQPIDAPLEIIPVGMSQIDDLKWYRLADGRMMMDAHILYSERNAHLTAESKWQVGVSIRYPESDITGVKWLGRGPYRVWRNRLEGQQFGTYELAYNNTVTGQYNTMEPPQYPEFKGYRSDMRWIELQGKRPMRITSLTEGLYFRLYTPEEAVDETPGEMGGMDEGKKKVERTMIPFPDGDISFLLSIPPMCSYKPLEQLGPGAQPDVIRIKPGDEGFHIRLIFENL